jgi:tetratricopeptide (TPR) repeat protein
LIIFGRGERLIDPVTGELTEWSGMFLEWHDRAVVTPVAPLDWNQREQTLTEQFLVFPATLEGIEQLAERFDSSVPAELEVSDADYPLPPDLDRDADLGKLRSYLGEPVFQWLCACAIYPELYWDLTLLLGSLPALGEHLVAERNMLRLVRIPWFRAGAIPDKRRLQLLAALDPVKEVAVRAAIVRALEKSPAPEASFAAENRRLEIVLQEGLLGRQSTRELKSTLRSVPLDELTRDYVLLHETRRISPLAFALPEQVRSLFFEKGIAALGLNLGARLGLTSAMIGAVLLAIAFLVPPGNTTGKPYTDKSRAEYPQTPLPQATLERGIDLAQQKQFDAAAEEFGKVIEQNRKDPRGYANRGTAYRQAARAAVAAGDQEGASTRYQSALADFSKYVELAPKDASAYLERGETEIELKQYDAALADLNKALELKPDDLTANKFRGFAELGLSQWDKAVADFTVVIQKKPDDLQSYDRRALAYRGMKNYDAAIADYTFLLSKNPNDVEALTKRGYTYSLALQYEKAIPDYEAALKVNPQDNDNVQRLQYAQSMLAAKNASPSPTRPSREIAKGDYPYGIPVPDKPDLVESPYVPGKYIDVAGFPSGTEVKDPYTDKTFLVPGGAETYTSPIPSPTSSDAQGGIDVESAGPVPPAAQAALSRALAAEGFAPRNWAVGKGPSDRVMVKHYSSEDGARAGSIRNALVRTLPGMRVEVQRVLKPPQNYRSGHVDIWLPPKAVELLLGGKTSGGKK